MTSPKDASPIATNKRFVLASASPRRLDLLAQLGFVPDAVIPAHIDETPLPRETPSALALRLATQKAAALASEAGPDTVVLAADTVVSVGRRLLPKAETEADATACLALLSGRGHRVQTGICVLAEGRSIAKCVTSRVKIKSLSQGEIAAYLASGEWQGKAGGYAIQGRAAAFVSSLVGSYSNIVGLPLYETANLLQGVGCRPSSGA